MCWYWNNFWDICQMFLDISNVFDMSKGRLDGLNNWLDMIQNFGGISKFLPWRRGRCSCSARRSIWMSIRRRTSWDPSCLDVQWQGNRSSSCPQPGLSSHPRDSRFQSTMCVESVHYRSVYSISSANTFRWSRTRPYRCNNLLASFLAFSWASS